MRCICIYNDHLSHLLDHLAPFCDLYDIPFIVTDDNCYDITKKYYPNVKTQYLPESKLSLEKLAKTIDVLLVGCKHWSFELTLTLQKLYKTAPRCIYLPHGNSDKGAFGKEELLIDQDLSFVYGSHMIDQLKIRKAYDTLNGVISIGNFRHHYYKKNKAFLDELANNDIFCRLKNNNPIVLYAPTWDDYENLSSFYLATKKIISSLPNDLNLIIKLHPKIIDKDPASVCVIEGMCKTNALVLADYPLVYPILDKVDIYLGDYSSVGYDFLYKDKPLFFIDIKEEKYHSDLDHHIYQTGRVISKEYLDKNPFDFIKKHMEKDHAFFSKSRQDLYSYTFNNALAKDDLLSALSQLINQTTYLPSIRH